MRSFFGMP